MKRRPLMLPGDRHVTSMEEACIAEDLNAAAALRLLLTSAEHDERAAYAAVVRELELGGPSPRTKLRAALDQWRSATARLTEAARKVEARMWTIRGSLIQLDSG
ncbi:hypothetical protein BO221_14070 [Archangium sp. Cb G35]|nr:hypothetical protein BO221_14070 [Archangium sp. Cb G35]